MMQTFRDLGIGLALIALLGYMAIAASQHGGSFETKPHVG